MLLGKKFWSARHPPFMGGTSLSCFLIGFRILTRFPFSVKFAASRRLERKRPSMLTLPRWWFQSREPSATFIRLKIVPSFAGLKVKCAVAIALLRWVGWLQVSPMKFAIPLLQLRVPSMKQEDCEFHGR